jgi:hypothetical protein
MPNALILAVKTRISSTLAPVSATDIAVAEARLGFPLPVLLRDLYQFVGNGRFGPGHGLLNLTDLDDGERSAIDQYLESRQECPNMPEWKWPEGVLPICDWGCNTLTCLDCLNSPYPVLTFEYVEGPMELSFMKTRDSLESWLQDWLAGIDVFDSLYEPAPEFDREGKNPRTGEPMIIKAKKPRRRWP